MKKFISFMVLVIMLLTCVVVPFNVYAANGNGISLYAVEEKIGALKLVSNKDSVSSGDTFTVSVEVTEEFTAGTSSILFNYDTSLFTLESITKGLVDAEEYSDGVLRGSRMTITDITYTGTLFSATFKVKSEVEAANYRFTFAQYQFATESAVMIVPTVTNLTVKINGGASSPTAKPTASPGPTETPKTPSVSMDINTLEVVNRAILSGNVGNVTLSLELANNAELSDGQSIMLQTMLDDDTLLSVDMWNGEGSKFIRKLSVPEGRYIKSASATLNSWYDVFPYFTAEVTGGTGISSITLKSGNEELTTESADNQYITSVAMKAKTYDVIPVYATGYQKKTGEEQQTVNRKSPDAKVEAEAKTYAVKYNKNGHGTDVADGSFIYDSNQLELAPQTDVTGYTFDGWYSDTGDDAKKVENAANLQTLITDNNMSEIVLYARWTANEYDVTYNANGHGDTPTEAKYTYDGEFTVADVLTETGYNFGGWFLDDETFNIGASAANIKSAVDNGAESITIYAKWMVKGYTVTYDAKGLGTEPESTTYTYASDFTIADALTEAGYTFGGWYLDDNTFEIEATAANIKSKIDSGETPITIYAKWTANPAVTAIAKATIADTETKEAEEALAVNYAIDSSVEEVNKVKTITVTADSLKSHKNGDTNPTDGYWAGVRFTLANMTDGAKVYYKAYSEAEKPIDTAALKAKEDVSSIVLTEDDLTNGWSIYSDAARYQEDGDRDGWKLYVAFDGIDTLYAIDFSGVKPYKESLAPTVTITAATIADTRTDETKIEQPFATNPDPTIGEASGIYIPVQINTTEVQEHRNGADEASMGYWTGAKFKLENVTDETKVYISYLDAEPESIDALKTAIMPSTVGDEKDSGTETAISVYSDAEKYLTNGERDGKYVYVYIEGMEKAYRLDFSKVTVSGVSLAANSMSLQSVELFNNDSEAGESADSLTRSYTTDIEIEKYNGGEGKPEAGYYAHICFNGVTNAVGAADSIIFALYTSDGSLKSINVCSIEDIGEYNEWITYLAPLSDDESMSGAWVKSFVWNSEEGMQPLSDSRQKQFPAV